MLIMSLNIFKSSFVNRTYFSFHFINVESVNSTLVLVLLFFFFVIPTLHKISSYLIFRNNIRGEQYGYVQSFSAASLKHWIIPSFVRYLSIVQVHHQCHNMCDCHHVRSREQSFGEATLRLGG